MKNTMNKKGSAMPVLLTILTIVAVSIIIMSVIWGKDLVQQVKWENQQHQAKELAKEQAKASMTKEELQEARMEEGRIAAEKMDGLAFTLICILSIMNFFVAVSNEPKLLIAYVIIAGFLWLGYGWHAFALSFIVSWFISLAFYALVHSAFHNN